MFKQSSDTEYRFEEIDLMGCVNTVIKNKWLVLGVFFVTVLLAGGWSLAAPRIYRVESSLEIGGVDGEPVEAPEEVVEKINTGIYGGPEHTGVKSGNPKGTDLIVMSVNSSDPEKAKTDLKEIGSSIIEKHKERMEAEKEFLDQESERDDQGLEDGKEVLERDIGLLQENISRLEAQIRSLVEEKKIIQAEIETLKQRLLDEMSLEVQLALFNAEERLEEKKQNIEEQYVRINHFKMEINALEGRIRSLTREERDVVPTKVVKPPTVSENPVSPKTKLNVGIGGVLGVLAGVLFAFVKEWWRKNKEKR